MEQKENIVNLTPKGVSGLNRTRISVDEEWHKDLRGTRAIKVYREMRDNDPIIGAMLLAIESQIRQCELTVNAANETNEAKFLASFIEECLYDMEMTWQEFLSDVLSMTWAGYSLHEVTYKIRRGPNSRLPILHSQYSDGLYGWRNIQIRAQETIDEWRFDDNGNVIAALQRAAPDYKVREIPINDCLLFKVYSNKSNPEGRSMLRNAYRTWYFLKRIQEFEAIGIEKDMTGTLVARLPEKYFSSTASSKEQETLENFRQLTERARRGEYDGIVYPAREDFNGKTGFDLEQMQSGGRKPMEDDTIIKRLESRIAISFLGEAILLGTNGSTGSWSLASSQTSLAAICLRTITRAIEDILNRDAIPRLVKLNGFSLESCPVVRFADVEHDAQVEFVNSISGLIGSGAVTVDQDLEDYLRAKMGLPKLSNPDLRQPNITSEIGADANQ